MIVLASKWTENSSSTVLYHIPARLCKKHSQFFLPDQSLSQYLKELAVLEMMCNINLDYDPLTKIQMISGPVTHVEKFVWSAPSSYGNTLAGMNWKDNERQMVDEVASMLQQYEYPSSSLWACVLAMGNCPSSSSSLKTICTAPHL